MKFRKTSLILVASLFLIVFTGISLYAQGMLGGKGMQAGGMMGGMTGGMMAGRGLGIIGILEAAGDPLTDEQITLINEIGRSPEAHNEIMAILTPSQVEALETYREENPGRQGMRAGGRGIRTNTERGVGMAGGMMGGRGLGIIGILEAAGDPLTDEQIALINEIERSPEAHNEIMAILIPSQVEALETYREENHLRQGIRGGRGMRAGGRRGGMIGGRGLGIIGILEAAGDPLTDEQIALINEIGRSPEAHNEIMEVLTDTQIETLKTYRPERFGVPITEDDTIGDPIEKALDNTPEAFSVLKQNYPNPFNPSTTIEYQLATAGDVKVAIYSQSGQLVETIVNENQNAGLHSVTWNASSHASGIYLCKITSGDFISTVKMSYIK